ncbi:MAG: hypothetical protein PHT69_05235 [Bacteroidales bacterium]|nr:hypothetical protein [Bacteroidales bacterium]
MHKTIFANSHYDVMCNFSSYLYLSTTSYAVTPTPMKNYFTSTSNTACSRAYSSGNLLSYALELGQDDMCCLKGAYRFGFNSQEKTDEIAGTGNHNTAEFWEYDTRTGRRWNIDPIVKYNESGYATFANNPIWFTDPNGKDTISTPNGDRWNVGNGYTTSKDKTVLFGEGLKTKVWNPKALGAGCEYNGNYVDYDPKIHGDIRNANTATATIKNALGNADRTIVQGGLLQDLKNDKGFINFENDVMQQTLEDTRFGNSPFAFDKKSTDPITFGGESNTYAPMAVQAGLAALFLPASMILFPRTWSAALTNTTWVVRHAYVNARVEVNARGIMSVTYSFEDALDLREGEDKTPTYNFFVRQLGKVWPGNQNMNVNGAWYKKYQKN